AHNLAGQILDRHFEFWLRHDVVPQVLISTSTPADRSSFISASSVCCVGSRMSSSRLCVRISNCSRDFLSTCGERSTQYLLIFVGSGMGPATLAPVRLAVSTISPADWSSSLWSYALSRIRIFGVVINNSVTRGSSSRRRRPRSCHLRGLRSAGLLHRRSA